MPADRERRPIPFELGFPALVRYRKPLYEVRPLLADAPLARARVYDEALRRFRQRVHETVAALSANREHLDELLLFAFDPEAEFRVLELGFEAGKHHVAERFDVAWFELRGQRIVCLPGFASFCFVLPPDQGAAEDVLRTAVVAAIQHLVRQRKRDDPELDVPAFLREAAAGHSDFVLPFRLHATTGAGRFPFDASFDGLFASFHEWVDEFDGDWELHKVGRDLRDLHPEGLQRALLRDTLVEQVRALVFSEQNDSFVLLGPRGSGRTSILHEAVFRTLDEVEADRHDRVQAVREIDPNRVIAGMAIVGMWQRRFTAMLGALMGRLRGRYRIERADRAYFDNLVALLRIGRSAQNALTLADVLRPLLEQRALAVVGEATPEEWALVQEKDRRFADLFRVVRVPECSPREAARIALHHRMELEASHECRIATRAVSRLFDMQRGFRRSQALPGGVVELLVQLATRHRKQEVGAAEADELFGVATGLSRRIFDPGVRLDPGALREEIAAALVGQDEAVDCLSDLVQVVKAGLHDPERPLGSLLLIGPTGVGKTQAAKVLARLVFSGEEGLLRFDMNEYVDTGAARRLIGDGDSPDGLLTSRVRHRPWGVLLFDEIEKAHPDVHDLLLQVLGEARLTDALGRTVDFANCFVVMTSNLGAREALRASGFVRGEADRQAAYRRSIEGFFRPEFVNRIDRVVMFGRLLPEHVQAIARILVAELLQREGFVRRSTVLEVSDEALAWIAASGYDPELGGRALKRRIEKELAAVAAAHLAGIEAGTPILFEVFRSGERLLPRVSPLLEAPARGHPPVFRGLGRDRLTRVYEGLETALQAALAALAARRASGADWEGLQLKERVLEVRERVSDALSRLREAGGAVSSSPVRGFQARGRWRPRLLAKYGAPTGQMLRNLLRALDVRRELAELHAAATRTADEALETVAQDHLEAGLLAFFARALEHGSADRVCLAARSLVTDRPQPAVRLQRAYARLLEDLGFPAEAESAGGGLRLLLASGPGLARLLGSEAGTHLFLDPYRAPVPVLVHVASVPAQAKWTAFAAELSQRRGRWLARVESDVSALAEDPFPPGPVLRLYAEEQDGLILTDPRSGAIARVPDGSSSELQWLLYAALPEAERLPAPPLEE